MGHHGSVGTAVSLGLEIEGVLAGVTVVLVAVDLIDGVLVFQAVGLVVEVGEEQCIFLSNVCSGVGAEVLVRHGAVAVEERGGGAGEADLGVRRVRSASSVVEIDDVDVPVVFIATAAGLRRINDAGVVVETETEAGLEKGHVGDGNHDLFEVGTVVLDEELGQSASRCAPDVMPEGVDSLNNAELQHQ